MRKWLTDIADLLARRIFGKTPPAPKQPELNRAARRALDKVKPGEQRMRMERTFIAQAKRRKSSRGDHGAKARRAHELGLQQGAQYTRIRVQQAYLLGLEKGRADHQPWYSIIPGLKRKAAA